MQAILEPLLAEAISGPAILGQLSGRIWVGATIHADLASQAMADLGLAAATGRLRAGYATSRGRFIDQDMAQITFGIRSVNATARGTSGLECDATLVRQ